ncbi:AAA family ATPase [Pararhodospirillum photometricum]|uniref:Aminoglycoside phosphotransferase domain-containing protein n=1 Tax=Pararhodospirillum photometricum DSM 122 TaxID=1150469 RepID=H6SRB1_PARPM|nr:bifunctional aminoglycoside phosphotransferase/ATP-binding protein [Pararhodospirillum photometricum]CCG09833.1 Putative uncharacterized protein [Pararhodospirillum photometricum DSM 122]
MPFDTQQAVLEFLARPATHGLAPTTPIEVIRTHISVVILAGARAFKLKRAVALPYLDHTTLQAREACCRHEVAINRLTAPGLYEGVIAVTRDPKGELALGGTGLVVEWLVVMHRFPQEALFDHLASQGRLDRHQMCDLAEAVHAAHNQAERITTRPDWLARILDNSLTSLESQAERLGADRAAALAAALRAEATARAPLLAERAAAGFVRRCHGDLHLGNIVLWQDRPTLFDAVEFNDLFVEIDVLYDLAYLVMDLHIHAPRRLASILFNHYMEFAGDTAGLALLPLFLALRATIRAFVRATAAAGQTDPAEAQRLETEARDYLDHARAFLAPQPPRLVAVGGLSGSGKSRLARELACFLGRAPGALVLRTDVLRKRLMGLTPYQPLGPEGYTPEVHARVYQTLEAEARLALAVGQSVVLDGVHAKPPERANAERMAAEAGVPFDGLWVHTPVTVALNRIETRVRNPSDVTPSVRANQEAFDLGAVTWTRIDASGPKEETVAKGVRALGLG